MKDMIFVHCSATPANWMSDKPVEAKRDTIKRWHTIDRGWSDIGYACVIDRDGSVAWGRDLDDDGDYYEETAAAARGFNTRGVHICLLGGAGSNENDSFSDHFTPEQDLAARKIIMDIMNHFNKKMWVRGHNEVAAKACPGFQVKDWWNDRPTKKKTILTSTTNQAAVGAMTANLVGGGTVISKLNDTSQTIAIVCVVLIALFLVYIMRERIKKLARGI